MQFKKKTLKNGLRIITVPTKGNPSVTVMVLAEVGSNYEKKSENGLSHFLEHMMFKGTPSRPSSAQISKELDSLGAVSNAFTNFEVTGYWVKGDGKHLDRFIDILSDMYLNANFPEQEIDKERGVVLQEVDMYEDLPMEKVQEEFLSLLYGDVPAGRPIIGTKENIKKFSRADLVKYREKHYVPSKTIVVVSGNFDEKEAIREISRQFKSLSPTKRLTQDRVKENQRAPALRIFRKKTDQTHMVIGFRAFGAGDKNDVVMRMLVSILGRGISSRLYSRLREEMGACYYIRSSYDDFTDHGVLTISTGIESRRAEEVTKAILEECKLLADKLVSREELEKAKEYYLGHLYIGLESSSSLGAFYADQEILSGKVKTPKQVEREIRAVTAKQIQALAKKIFQNKNLNLAVVGNIKDEKPLKRALKL